VRAVDDTEVAGTSAPPAGVFTYDALKTRAAQEQEYRIERLVPMRSIGIRVGDSGLGKTALSMMEGLAIASGTPFLGFRVEAGQVLYCDAESGMVECVRMIERLSSFLGLSRPPDEFQIWSPNFDTREPPPDKSLADLLVDLVRATRPDHVVVDPLRAFWPEAEDKSKDSMAMVHRLRGLSREFGCSWTLNHHRRKRNWQYTVSLENDRHIWFEEAAGALALINASDTRLGLEQSTGGRGDLVMAGFIRSVGWTGSLHLERVHDDNGDPLGYRLMTGVAQLNTSYQQAFGQLSSRFRFKDALGTLGGTSSSNTTAFLKQCIAVGVLRKEGNEYIKVE
jgi:hypothetical protein